MNECNIYVEAQKLEISFYFKRERERVYFSSLIFSKKTQHTNNNNNNNKKVGTYFRKKREREREIKGAIQIQVEEKK